MNVLVPIPKSFPRSRPIMVLRKRGIGQASSTLTTLGFPFLGLLTSPEATSGTLSPSGVQSQLAATHAANVQAATDPNTGVVNQAQVAQADALAAQEIPAAANVSNISTGSWWANLVDMFQGTYTGALGWPGSTPPLGTPVAPASPTGGIDWTSILETVALYGGIGLGAYLLIKVIIKK
jgi:hypothetical protein